jgi:hypothetical protein
MQLNSSKGSAAAINAVVASNQPRRGLTRCGLHLLFGVNSTNKKEGKKEFCQCNNLCLGFTHDELASISPLHVAMSYGQSPGGASIRTFGSLNELKSKKTKAKPYNCS